MKYKAVQRIAEPHCGEQLPYDTSVSHRKEMSGVKVYEVENDLQFVRVQLFGIMSWAAHFPPSNLKKG